MRHLREREREGERPVASPTGIDSYAAGGFAPAEYYTVDLVRSSLNPVGGPTAAGGYGLPGLPQPPLQPHQQHGDIGFDPLKVFNVVRGPRPAGGWP